MDIHKNPRIFKIIPIKPWMIKDRSIKTWISIHGYFYGYPLQNVLAWISLLDIDVDVHPCMSN